VKPFSQLPNQILVGLLIFAGLLFGGYFVGSTHAVSTQPFYLTDSSGSNAANINAQGHLSVHIADPSLPASSGPLVATRMPFRQVILEHNECYAAYTRGVGSFLTASVTDLPRSGSGRPSVLVRLDRATVFLENGSAAATPTGPTTGVVRSGTSLAFGFSYPLAFKAFAGVVLCWRGPGRSDAVRVVMTLAGNGGGELIPEDMFFLREPGGHFRWWRVRGPVPVGYQLYGSRSTLVQYYHPLAPVITYTAGRRWYAARASRSYPRYYVFETQPGSDPTRVGPFGSWTGL